MIYLTNNHNNKFPIVYPLLEIATVPMDCNNASSGGTELMDCGWAGSTGEVIDCGWAYTTSGTASITLSLYHIVTREHISMTALPVEYTRRDVTMYVEMPLTAFVGDYECKIYDGEGKTYFKGLVRLGEPQQRGTNYNRDNDYTQYER